MEEMESGTDAWTDYLNYYDVVATDGHGMPTAVIRKDKN
jgi:hypothetical protein